jgi:hypothetical protein
VKSGVGVCSAWSEMGWNYHDDKIFRLHSMFGEDRLTSLLYVGSAAYD